MVTLTRAIRERVPLLGAMGVLVPDPLRTNLCEGVQLCMRHPFAALQCMLVAGCWMLDGRWMLDAGCWMLDAKCTPVRTAATDGLKWALLDHLVHKRHWRSL
jgi:hypothetical protein